MYTNILMKKPGIYIPENVVDNQYYIDHFHKLGMECEGLLKHLGRVKRHFANANETPLTMSIKSVANCFQENNMKATDIDMVIFASDSPEYIIANNAVRIVNEIGASNAIMAFDFNSNCTSMAQAIEIAKGTMLISDNITNVMIVGCFQTSMSSREDDTVVYANFGDASATIILTKVQENIKRGFLDVETHLDPSYCKVANFPKCGMTKSLSRKVPVEPIERRLEWIPFDSKFFVDVYTNLITKILTRNSKTPKDISYYVFSALSNFDNVKTLNKLGITENDGKYYYFGDKYGYTGCTCQALCLNQKWDLISKKDNEIILCTVGAGASFIAQLYKF